MSWHWWADAKTKQNFEDRTLRVLGRKYGMLVRAHAESDLDRPEARDIHGVATALNLARVPTNAEVVAEQYARENGYDRDHTLPM